MNKSKNELMESICALMLKIRHNTYLLGIDINNFHIIEHHLDCIEKIIGKGE